MATRRFADLCAGGRRFRRPPRLSARRSPNAASPEGWPGGGRRLKATAGKAPEALDRPFQRPAGVIRRKAGAAARRSARDAPGEDFEV